MRENRSILKKKNIDAYEFVSIIFSTLRLYGKDIPREMPFLKLLFDITEALWKKMMYVYRIQNKYKKLAFT